MIKKFKEFENVGWEEEPLLKDNVSENEINIGDIVRVDKDFVIAGETIIHRHDNCEVTGLGRGNTISLKGKSGWFPIWAFKKFVPVALDDIDPYGEEDWDDIKLTDIEEDTIIKLDDEIWNKSMDGEYEYYGRVIEIYLNVRGRGEEFTIRKKNGLFYLKTKSSLIDYKYKIRIRKELLKESVNMKPEQIKAAVDLIKTTIKNTEWEGKVFIAGGYVRDELMGNEPKDVDLLINVPDGGILFAEWFTKKLGIHTKGNPVIYPRFGTAKFNLRRQKHNGMDLSDIDIECVMPRKEKYNVGDRKPDVEQGTLKDDVDRRDFTTNSLLKNLSSGEILDLTGMGKDDIKNGIVRTPLDPDVIFTDDPLRMLRAVRFATKYSWKLPMFMIRSLKKNAKKLELISSERIQEELNKMLLTKNPDKAIRLLQILGLSKYIFPELDKLIKMKQNKFHKHDAMRHTLEVLKNTPPDLVTRLSALLHDIGKSKTRTEKTYIKCVNCDKKIEVNV